MFSRWISLKGLSRASKTSFRFSLRATSAERVMSESPNPDANGSQRFHAARRNDHAVGFERTARNGRGLVFVMIDDGGQAFNLRQRAQKFRARWWSAPTG